MFKKARILLTAWYLLIIVTISLAFSVVIYKVLTNEVERFARIQRIRIEHGLFRDLNNLPSPPNFDPELVSEVKGRIILFLFLANGVIVIASGGLSYFLAGRTLQPIKEMIEEQNSFVSNASHDLRTPLSAVSLSLEVAQKDKNLTIHGAREVLNQCLKQVLGLQKLTEDLLELSKSNYQLHNPSFTDENLHHLLQEVTAELSPIIKERGIVITNKTSPHLQIYADKSKIKKLFLIILDNAIKYSRPKGKIILSSLVSDSRIQLSFRDDGIGINKNEIDKIFDKFYRSDKSRTNSQTKGFGLGLSIAKDIAKLHHGDITVKSILGKGSTFTLQLPFSNKTRI